MAETELEKAVREFVEWYDTHRTLRPNHRDDHQCDVWDRNLAPLRAALERARG